MFECMVSLFYVTSHKYYAIILRYLACPAWLCSGQCRHPPSCRTPPASPTGQTSCSRTDRWGWGSPGPRGPGCQSRPSPPLTGPPRACLWRLGSRSCSECRALEILFISQYQNFNDRSAGSGPRHNGVQTLLSPQKRRILNYFCNWRRWEYFVLSSSHWERDLCFSSVSLLAEAQRKLLMQSNNN